MKIQFVKIPSPRMVKAKQFENADCQLERSQQKWMLMKKAAKIRDQAINFLWKACSRFSFKKDTLFLAIKIVDLLIQQNFKPIFDDFQLTSASLVILATKYNEVYPVTIDKISLITQKFYLRQKFFEIEGLILECLKFEIPQTTVYSQVYNEMKKSQGKNFLLNDSDKQNNVNSENIIKANSQKIMRPDEDNIVTKTLKAIREPQCFKYGQQILVSSILHLIKNERIHGNSLQIVKINYVKSILKRIFQPQKLIEQQKRRTSISKCVSPLRDQKLNPQKKFMRKQVLYC